MMQEIAAQPAFMALLLGGLILMGTCAGILAGLFGIGGGIILVPTISTALHLLGTAPDNAMRIAVATSLATIIPSSFSSLRAHHRRAGIDWDLLKYWSPFIILGAVFGSYTASFISGKMIGLLLGLVMLYNATRFIKPIVEHTSTKHRIGRAGQKNIAFAIGCSSAMLGIGGGVIGVPAMNYIGLPLKRAIGTASTFGIMVAVPGAINYLLADTPMGVPLGGTWGLVHPFFFALLVPGAVLGAPIGAHLTHSLPVAQLRRWFALLVAILGMKMLYSSLLG